MKKVIEKVYIFFKVSLSFGFLENVNFPNSRFLINKICFKMKEGVKRFLMLSHFNIYLQILPIIHL